MGNENLLKNKFGYSAANKGSAAEHPNPSSNAGPRLTVTGSERQLTAAQHTKDGVTGCQEIQLGKQVENMRATVKYIAFTVQARQRLRYYYLLPTAHGYRLTNFELAAGKTRYPNAISQATAARGRIKRWPSLPDQTHCSEAPSPQL